MNEWISIEDRLPEIEVDTLLVCVKCENSGDYFSDTDGFQDGSFVYWSSQAYCNVTHWMFIPEPQGY